MVQAVSLACLALLLAAAPATASTLLTPLFEAQLEGWLAAGPLDFIEVYKKDGINDSSTEFHAVADTKGATFVLFEAMIDGQVAGSRRLQPDAVD